MIVVYQRKDKKKMDLDLNKIIEKNEKTEKPFHDIGTDRIT